MQTRLERSTTNRIVGGICGGIAEYLQIDATLVRVFFVIIILLTAGVAVLGYAALLFIIPLPGQPQPFVRNTSAAPSDQPGADATGSATADTMRIERAAPVPEDPAVAERRRSMFGYFLVGIGAIFLLSNLGMFRLVRGDLLWPLVLIAAGAFILTQRMRS